MPAAVKKTLWSVISDYLVVTLGMLIFVLAWVFFLVPSNLLAGGVSGICAIIYYATGFPMGISNAVINSVLIIISIFVLGRGFGFKTIYAIILSSLFFTFLPGLIPPEIPQSFAENNGKILCAIIGGVLEGVSIGLTFTRGGSTGGTDIIAMMINKYKDISPGTLLFTIDLFIIGSSLLVPSYTAAGALESFGDKVAIAFYALILVAVSNYSLDTFLTGVNRSVQVFIFSKKYEEIADALAFDLNRGVTLLRSRGWFHKQESEVIMVVARKYDLSMLLSYVKGIDPGAFISVNSLMGVYGQGFDMIKDKPRKAAAKHTDEKENGPVKGSEG